MRKGSKHSLDTRNKISKLQKGIKKGPITSSHREKIRKAKLGKSRPMLKGKPLTMETRKKMSVTQLARREKHWFWKGGVSTQNQLIRRSFEYRLWREMVWKRDNWKCVWCGKRQGWNKELQRRIIIHADHIKPFAYFPELRFALDNGRTLCFDCHKTTDTWGVNKKLL